MPNDNFIEVKGGRANNLKNIDLKIPRDKLIVVTGVSGSGKSSLAFDTLYAEGQRRYVESLSSYARQFLGRMSKPECDYIKGLPPAIAIEQKVAARNPRSTVGTSTEIYEYLRLLYARIGRTFSPVSGQEVKKQSASDVVAKVLSLAPGTRFMVVTNINPTPNPANDNSTETAVPRSLEKQLQVYLQEGYSRVLAGGEVRRIEDVLQSAAGNATPLGETGRLSLVVDRMSVSDDKDTISRLTDSVETAMFEGHGSCSVVIVPSNISYDFSTRFEADGITFEEPNDNMFSFNSPAGACPECEGYGSVIGIDERLVVPNTSLSVYDGCVQCWHGEKMKMWQEEFCRRAKSADFPIFTPYYELTSAEKAQLWHGLPCDKDAKGNRLADAVCIDAFFQMVKDNQYKIQYRVMLSRYRGKTICPTCQGTRLRKEATWVKINGRAITDLVEMPISKLKEWFANIDLTAHEQQVAKRLLTEIRTRLSFLCDVGLGYLTLARHANTLSGGESQRARLTTSLGSPLVGSLYILDEPSIGLHSRDTRRLLAVLRKLQQAGNTVIVVEHDEEIMRAADWLIDIGPDAGRNGGEVVYEGLPIKAATSGSASIAPKELLDKYPKSYTLRYLSGQDTIAVPSSRRHWNMSIKLKGCRMNNLCGIDAEFPLNVLTAVTGVSGSGKSSLVKGTLFPALKRRLDEVAEMPGEHNALEGDWNYIKHVEFVDQNPIGKSTRSNPATYLKAYEAIRALYAEQPLAKQLGFTAQYFSFNADGGRCEECKGAGEITVEMQFMADLTLTCEACHGKRFKKDILDVRYEGKNIDDVLNMTVDEAVDFFGSHGQKTITNRLRCLQDVGLGYIQLGQSSSTLSGGENQRVKLAYFIGQEKQEPTLFIFDEPTTGLHFHDISRLLSALNALIERGHTVIVIEHNLDVIRCADWVIDIGPGGGNAGGKIVAKGTPEDIAKSKESATGGFLFS